MGTATIDGQEENISVVVHWGARTDHISSGVLDICINRPRVRAVSTAQRFAVRLLYPTLPAKFIQNFVVDLPLRFMSRNIALSAVVLEDPSRFVVLQPRSLARLGIAFCPCVDCRLHDGIRPFPLAMFGSTSWSHDDAHPLVVSSQDNIAEWDALRASFLTSKTQSEVALQVSPEFSSSASQTGQPSISIATQSESNLDLLLAAMRAVSSAPDDVLSLHVTNEDADFLSSSSSSPSSEPSPPVVSSPPDIQEPCPSVPSSPPTARSRPESSSSIPPRSSRKFYPKYFSSGSLDPLWFRKVDPYSLAKRFSSGIRCPRCKLGGDPISSDFGHRVQDCLRARRQERPEFQPSGSARKPH